MYNEKTNAIMRSGVLTAFSRCFTNIPNSQELFYKSLNHMLKLGINFQPQLFTAELAVELEARYKSIDKILSARIKEYKGQCIVLEIGAGLSTRKMNFYSKVLSYIELDFPALMQEKEKIYNEFDLNYIDEYIGMDLEDDYNFNYLKERTPLEKINAPVIVICEGLFWYLKADSVERLAQNMYELLNIHGGCWIVGDCPVEIDYLNLPEYRKIVSTSTGAKMNQPFETIFDFKSLFQNNGFDLQCYDMEKLIPIQENFSAQLFGIDNTIYLSRLKSYCDIALLQLKTTYSD